MKTWPKQVLGSLPLAFVLPGYRLPCLPWPSDWNWNDLICVALPKVAKAINVTMSVTFFGCKLHQCKWALKHNCIKILDLELCCIYMADLLVLFRSPVRFKFQNIGGKTKQANAKQCRIVHKLETFQFGRIKSRNWTLQIVRVNAALDSTVSFIEN